MTRHLKLNNSPSIKVYEQQKCVILTFDKEEVAPFALEMCLLWQSLSEQLVLFGDSTLKVELIRCNLQQEKSNRIFADEQHNKLKFFFPEQQANALLFFLLRAYRDGFAEVDHMDFESISVESAGSNNFRNAIDITVKFTTVGLSISNDELRRRIGL